MPRFFNTAGPNIPEWHYTLPALARLPEVSGLIEDKSWFVVHAARQTGKTTAMRALAKELTAGGGYAALWATCEAGEPYRDAPDKASRIVASSILRSAENDLPQALRPPPIPTEAPEGEILSAFLEQWARQCPRPIVLLLDEIDALQNDALISVLRQLRSIYPNRPDSAPSTIALIGLRDVRDYRVASTHSTQLGSASPFNVKVASLTLRNFTRDEVAELYHQHTTETGQPFTPAAIDLAFELTGGQPWLVNALAYRVCREVLAEDIAKNQAPPIDIVHIARAKELLILARSTHLDSLADKLNDPRVRSVIAPILAGEPAAPARPNDIEYCIDLGLLTRTRDGLEISNPIYREVLPRELAFHAADAMPHIEAASKRRWALPDGKLDLRAVLEAFVAFWREHGEWMVRGQSWPEAAHQIVFMAFLQRLVNGGGYIDREYGLGRRRMDLLIRWFEKLDARGLPTKEDRHGLELKVWRDNQKDPLEKGLVQLDEYLARLSLDSGTLIIFDARSTSPTGDDWESRGHFSEILSPSARKITLLRL